ILEATQIDTIGQQLFRYVDEMDRKKLVLDFSKVQFLASAAVGVLLQLRKKSSAINGEFVICGMRKELKQVFEIMKITKLFTFTPDEKAALRKFDVTASG
ncbi:MAG: STAS domain-containing protein, partial [Rhodospirillales bacterium]|nr:STAS domain-containing protein [Rhodospirillales bacterium]